MPSREVISQMVAEFGAVDTGFESGVNRVNRSMANLSTSTNMHMSRVATGVSMMSRTSLSDMDSMARGIGMMAQGFGAARLGAIGFAAAVGVEAGNAINQLVKTLTGTSISEKLAEFFGPAADAGGADPRALAMRAQRQASEFQKAMALAGKGIDMSKTFFTPDEMKAVAESGFQDMINKVDAIMSTPENKIKLALWKHKDLEEQKKKAEQTAREIADVTEQRARFVAGREIEAQEKVIAAMKEKSMTIGGDAKSLWGQAAKFQSEKPTMLAEKQLEFMRDRETNRQMLVELQELNDNLTKNGLVVVK